MNIARKICIAAASAALLGAPAARAESNQSVLLLSYIRLLIAQQAPSVVADIAKDASAENKKQIVLAASRWTEDQIAGIRSKLEQHFPGQSRDVFREYVTRYTEGEQKQDAVFLKQTADALGLRIAPDYPTLRASLLQSTLKPDVDAESAFLGEVQTWLDVKQRQPDKTPALEIWLTRNQRGPAKIAPAARAAAPVEAVQQARPSDPLASAEAAPVANADVNVPADASPLDSISTQEKSRREKRLEEASAQMAQISAERKQFEDQNAAQKQAVAQAEADSMKHQAEMLAAVEQTAMQQRADSWSAHLKNAVGALIGAVGGAAGGVVGVQAGERAAGQIFR